MHDMRRHKKELQVSYRYLSREENKNVFPGRSWKLGSESFEQKRFCSFTSQPMEPSARTTKRMAPSMSSPSAWPRLTVEQVQVLRVANPIPSNYWVSGLPSDPLLKA